MFGRRRAVPRIEAQGDERTARDRIELLQAELRCARLERDEAVLRLASYQHDATVAALKAELIACRAELERARDHSKTLTGSLEALQSELRRLGSERDDLRSELTRAASAAAPRGQGAFRRALAAGEERAREIVRAQRLSREPVERGRFEGGELDSGGRLEAIAPISRIEPIR